MLVFCAGRSLATLSEARTEANKTNKEIKLKKLKVELVPRCKWWSGASSPLHNIQTTQIESSNNPSSMPKTFLSSTLKE